VASATGGATEVSSGRRPRRESERSGSGRGKKSSTASVPVSSSSTVLAQPVESTTKSVTDDHTPHNPESSGTSEAESKNSLERGEVVAPDTELHTQDVTD